MADAKPKKGRAPTYEHLALTPAPAPAPATTPESSSPRRTGRPPLEGPTLREAGERIVTYISPAAKKALKLYAVEADRPVNDLVVDALQQWCDRHGLDVRVRAREENAS